MLMIDKNEKRTGANTSSITKYKARKTKQKTNDLNIKKKEYIYIYK